MNQDIFVAPLVALISVIIVLLVRVAIDLLTDGSKVSDLRQAGFNVYAWMFGEPRQGRLRRRASVRMRDGMHVRVQDGKFKFRRKSAPTSDIF